MSEALAKRLERHAIALGCNALGYPKPTSFGQTKYFGMGKLEEREEAKEGREHQPGEARKYLAVLSRITPRNPPRRGDPCRYCKCA
jgi:hypothetical protein